MSIVVFAPASVANVSAGFDALGFPIAPIDGSLIGDKVFITDADSAFSLVSSGRFKHKLPDDYRENIIYDCYLGYAAALEKRGLKIKSIAMELEKNLPIGSGLGSSAASIVAGLEALNVFHDNSLEEHEMVLLMGELEGKISGSVHYDNVAPCALGGMQLMLNENGVVSQSVPCFDEWYWVVAYPGINISTAAARDILPTQYSRADCLTYGRHLAGFIHACYSKQQDLAAAMLQDVIAEPYRSQLIPKFDDVRDYAKELGALATGISGSGPTVFNVMTDLAQAEKLKAWLDANFIQNDDGFTHICKLDKEGARVVGREL
ncbi:homoserine kinase [Moritella marina ATCC 15381]|uniref:Homoserine kinase n=1 Tax=Moritella marina ATCC 15381 TaxID=1202962 RepID=A0A5J6WN02_MORMI|nr:homoserine kinase [Moritella marina]QFI38824.1 homoserine kinase [Moritella marina ATCC 15381]